MDECSQGNGGGGWFHWILLFLFSIWESWLGKTKRLIANSTWGIILGCIKRREKVEKDIKVAGGDLDIKLQGAVAMVEFKAAVDAAALKVGVSIEMDAGALIDKLEAAVEAKFPAGAPVEKAVFALLKAAVSSA